MASGGGFVTWVRTEPPPPDEHPFTLPVVREVFARGGIGLDPGVTFLVGDNGSGKSTLLEALAVVFGMNLEGGSRNFRFSTRPERSALADHLVACWKRRPRTDFFLRAESFYNAATYVEELPGGGLGPYGGRSLHERSHGESFLDVALHRFGPDGLYLLDEPEAALSVRGCLALLRRVADLRARRCQFVVATHSPILLALPGALILQIDEDGALTPTGYDEAEPVRLTRGFLAEPDRLLRELLAD
ncbi:AAA family ATPase [Pseudonocardia humida]|uniref:AAA family ATPase n=1 Tax=Pseudonocardia humida TaxID=2800819 RepID=A0ABT0ZZ59_9PSEU|nr:AAA family ATPase [Pseudonocardia humida]MCO1656034.1 AAA family ATPase [Pseudonocardia humida]